MGTRTLRLVLNFSTTSRIVGLSLGLSLVQRIAIWSTRNMCCFWSQLALRRSFASSTASLRRVAPRLPWLWCTMVRTHATMCMESPKLGSTGCFPVSSSSNRMPYEYTSTFGVTLVPNPYSAYTIPDEPCQLNQRKTVTF